MDVQIDNGGRGRIEPSLSRFLEAAALSMRRLVPRPPGRASRAPALGEAGTRESLPNKRLNGGHILSHGGACGGALRATTNGKNPAGKVGTEPAGVPSGAALHRRERQERDASLRRERSRRQVYSEPCSGHVEQRRREVDNKRKEARQAGEGRRAPELPPRPGRCGVARARRNLRSKRLNGGCILGHRPRCHR